MEGKQNVTKSIVFDQFDDIDFLSLIKQYNILPNSSSNVQIVEAMQNGVKLPDEIIAEIQTLAGNYKDTNESLHAKHILCVHAAWHGTFVEPMYVEDLLDLVTTHNITIRRCILWKFASTIPCSTILSSMTIQSLHDRLNDPALGWGVFFIFRKLSEDEEYMKMVSDDQWMSVANFLCNSELNDHIRLNILYTMMNIFKNRKEISNLIKIQLEKLITSDDVPEKLINATMKTLYLMVLNGMSLDSKTLDKLHQLKEIDHDATIESLDELLDFLDNKQLLSKAMPHKWSIKVQRELVATQTISVSHSKEKVIEPIIQFLSLDHILNRINHFDRPCNTESEPFIVETGGHIAWYRTTLQKIENLSSKAKRGELKIKHFDYLIDKMNDGWHYFTLKKRASVYEMIANTFLEAARFGQKLPDNVIATIINRLTNESTTLNRTITECILHVARRKALFQTEQINKIEKIIQDTNDNKIKQNLIEIYALCASKDYHINLNLDSIEQGLLIETTSVMISFLFLQAAAIEKRTFTPQQMHILIEVGKSDCYPMKAREQSLFALVYSIKEMKDKQSISEELIISLGEILKDDNENIRYPAAITLCYYAKDNINYLSDNILEQLATMLHCQEDNLVNNILSVYLNLVKTQKKLLSPFVLDNITQIIDRSEFDLRNNAIWILKYVVDNDQILSSTLLDRFEYYLNDEYRIRNIAANIFIEYWHRQLTKNNNSDYIRNIFLNYIENLLIIFQNRFKLDTQIRTLVFLKYLIENNYHLSEAFLYIIECCLCNNQSSIVENAVNVLMLYMKRNPISKRTILSLENVLRTDTKILNDVISMLKLAVCQGHTLSDKSIVFLGYLLFKTNDPNEIVLLLTFVDRHQPLLNNVNDLLRQHYYVDVLRYSISRTSFFNAYNGLLTLTASGHLLSQSVLESLFFLLESSVKYLSLLSIIVNVTTNQQHLTANHIKILAQIFFQYKAESLTNLIKIFTQFSRQNHAIPDVIISSLVHFLDDSSINIYIIEIYRHLIERQKLIDPKIIDRIVEFLQPSAFETISPDFQYQLISFFSTLANTLPIETDQTYLPFLLDIRQSLLIRKEGCLIASTLIEHDQILTNTVIDAIIHLYNNDVNIDVKQIAFNVLNLARSKTNQPMNNSIYNLLDLNHSINTKNDEDFLRTIRTALQANLKLEDEHFIKLSRILYSCILNLKYEAAELINLAISRQTTQLNLILNAIYGTLRDETINLITIPLLFESTSPLSSITINDLLYIAIHSSQKIVQENARRILQTSMINPNVKQFFEYEQDLQNFDRSLIRESIENNLIKRMLSSTNDNKVLFGLKIVRSMILLGQQISFDLLLNVTNLLRMYNQISSEILIRQLKNEIKLNNVICEIIEDVFASCRTKEMVMLIQILAIKRHIFKLSTLNILVDMLKDQTTVVNDLYLTLDYAAQHQPLSESIIDYFIKQLSHKSKEIVQQSTAIIHHQILKQHHKNSIKLLQSIQLPSHIDQKKWLAQLETFEECLGTIYTLNFVDYVGSTIFDLPAEQWSRQCLCINLLAGCSNTTSDQISTFYHQLTQLEQYKQYQIYSNDRDTILRALTRKQRVDKLDLLTINQTLIYLKTLTDISIEILLINDSNWLKDMRKYFIRDKLDEYLSHFMYSEVIINHLVNLISEQDHLSADLIESFLRIACQPEDILISLDIISKYEITNSELIKLFAQTNNTVDFKLFLNRMKSIILYRIFLWNSTGSKEQLQIGERYLNHLFEQGWIFETMKELLNNVKTNTESSENLNKLNECLKMLIDYKVDGRIATQLNKIFTNEKSSLWPSLVHTCIIDYRFGSQHSEKTIATLLNEIQRDNSIDFKIDLADMLKRIDEKLESNSSILPQNDQIKLWNKSNIQNWAKEIFHQQSEQFVKNNLIEVIAVIKRAIQLDSNFIPRHIQLIAVMIMLDLNHCNGCLLQILTGEGKSIVVAILAVIKALEGKQVDVITSSITLAKRDAQERKNFYNMFNLTVSHNNDEVNYIEGPKSCYRDNIVYGNSSQFQFDILRHDFSLLNTRENRRYDIVIIDEVDSMLIDENNTIARLADQLPGMEWINPLLYTIWMSIQMNTNPMTNRDMIVKHHKQLLHHPQSPWKVPHHLKNFVLDSIPSWIDHAILAKVEYRLDHHYIIKPDETRTKRILPIDYSNTGVIQCNTTWGDGLHQFLQLKHGLKVTPISITTNYLSNIGLFTRYGKQIYGFTGTLGSNDARQLLKKIYHVDTIMIPSFKEKRHFSFKPILTLTDDNWLNAILSSTIDQVTQKRAVLIICETRLDAKTIFKALRYKHCTSSIRLYTDNTDDIELSVVSNRIEQSEIIVATNLAGRGTDLKTSQDVENHGGLHICLTYLPNNLRVEDQAFGRTSRQGNRGTSQIILNQDRVLYQLMGVYSEFLKDQHQSLNDPIDLIRFWREKAESTCLDTIWKEEIPEIKEKDHLFQQFCTLLSQLRQRSDDNYQLLNVKERWGLWLKSNEHVHRNQRKLQKLIETVGFVCMDIQSYDEKNFFHVLSQQLKGEQIDTNQIKQAIIEHMVDNEHLYEILTEESRYIAASQALNMNIVLYRSDYGGPCVYKFENAKRTCLIGYEADTHYVSLQPSNSNDQWIQTYLLSINIDCSVKQESSSTTTIKNIINKVFRLSDESKREEKKKKFEEFFLTKIVHSDVQNAFEKFQDQMKKEYNTDKIIQNPCYLLSESNSLIIKHSSLINRIRSISKMVLPMVEKLDPFDKAVDRLKRAINIDPIFSFSAYINYAHIIIHKGGKPSTYKVEAKSNLLEAYKQINEYILPQQYSMRMPSTNEMDEPFFDDFAQQTQIKISILELYQEYINKAIETIGYSQNLIDIYSNVNGQIHIGKGLYHQEAQEFLSKSQGIIDMSFHGLTITEDIGKCYQAIQLVELLSTDNDRVSIRLMNINLQQIETIMSKTKFSTVCLNIQYLDPNEILDVIENDRVDIMVITSKEQYQKIIEIFSDTIILTMDSIKQELSSSEALQYLKSHTTIVNSMTLKSIDRKTINIILQQIEQAIFTLTFNDISLVRIRTIANCILKPISIYFKNLSKQDACTLIKQTKVEQMMILDLHDLTKQRANDILKKFLENIHRNEHDITTTLKCLAECYSKSDQPTEELNTYAYMGVQLSILVKQLNPRPWCSLSLISSSGVCQIIGGICLATFTIGIGTNIGIALIIEGINDIFYAIRRAFSRNVSLTDYAQKKAISLSLCFISIGFSTITQAALVAWSHTHNLSQLFHNTLHGTVGTIQNSFTGLHHGVSQGGISNGWTSVHKQVVKTCVETCVKNVSNYSILFTIEQLVSLAHPAIMNRIEHTVNTAYNNDYIKRLLTQALNADAYYGYRQWQEKLEQETEHILRNDKNRLVETIKALGNDIWTRLTDQSKDSTQEMSTSSESINHFHHTSHTIKQNFLTILSIINGTPHINTITKIFFDDLNKSFARFEQKIPTFQQLLIDASKRSISLETADKIYQCLLTEHILTETDAINVYQDDTQDLLEGWPSSSPMFDTLNQNSKARLKQNLEKITFTDIKHKEYVLNVLNKLLESQQNSLHTSVLRKKVIDQLVTYISTKLTLFYHRIIMELTNNTIKKTMSTQNNNLQQIVNPANPMIHPSVEIDTRKQTDTNENDIFNNIQQSEIQHLLSNTELLDFPMIKRQDEFRNSICLSSVITTLTKKAISVVQQEITSGFIQDMHLKCNAFPEVTPTCVVHILLHQSFVNKKFLIFEQSNRDMAAANVSRIGKIINWLTSMEPYLDIELKTLTILYPRIKLLERAGFELHHIRVHKKALKDQQNKNDLTLDVIREMLLVGNLGIMIYCSYKGIECAQRLQEYQNAIEKYHNDLLSKSNSRMRNPDYDFQFEEYLRTESHVVIIHMCEHGSYHYVPGKKDILKTDTYSTSNISVIHDHLQWYNTGDDRYMSSHEQLNRATINSLSVTSDALTTSSMSRQIIPAVATISTLGNLLLKTCHLLNKCD